MNVIGYTRVSTEEQANSGLSLEAQRAKIVGYCDVYDLCLVDVISDPGATGKHLRRPGLEHALLSLESGRAEGMVITKLDRLSRSIVEWNYLIDRYFDSRAKCQLFSVGDSIDTRSAAGRLVLNVLMSVAQWEREIISERTREALAVKIKSGQRVGAIRYGYDLDSDGRTLKPNRPEQVVVRYARMLRACGHSTRAIARRLSSRSVPTKTGNAVWTHQAIARILARA